MRVAKLFSFFFSTVLLSGCVESHRSPAVYYTSPTTVPPVSERPDVRVYSAPVPPVVTQPLPPPVSDPDVALGVAISQLLKGQPSLASISSKVSATVSHGVVTLKGTVPTDNDREEIKERVAKLPGVAGVTDELGVDLR